MAQDQINVSMEELMDFPPVNNHPTTYIMPSKTDSGTLNPLADYTSKAAKRPLGVNSCREATETEGLVINITKQSNCCIYTRGVHRMEAY